MDANNSGTLPTRDELNAELLEVPEPPEQPEAINEPAYEDIVPVALRHVRARRGGDLVSVILVGSGASDIVGQTRDVIRKSLSETSIATLCVASSTR